MRDDRSVGARAMPVPACTDALILSYRYEGILMIQNRLRVYCCPDAEGTTTILPAAQTQTPTVTVPAAEVFEALADAIQYGRAWLNDFADDEVTLSRDLHEVILAYQQFRRPSA